MVRCAPSPAATLTHAVSVSYPLSDTVTSCVPGDTVTLNPPCPVTDTVPLSTVTFAPTGFTIPEIQLPAVTGANTTSMPPSPLTVIENDRPLPLAFVPATETPPLPRSADNTYPGHASNPTE